MIKRVLYKELKDGTKLYKRYSDIGLKLKKIGTDEYYTAAIDSDENTYLYMEVEEEEKDE